MIAFDIARDPPWFFQYIETFSHMFLDIKFKTEGLTTKTLNFTLDLDFTGFEGLIFYIYKPKTNKFEFDIIDNRTEVIHSLKNLYISLEDYGPKDSVDIVIIPFGQFKEENRFIPTIRSGAIQSSYQIFTWTPSILFKNIKSVIRISNRYNELVPMDALGGYYYHFDLNFKGNKTEYIFTLINILVRLENLPNIEPIVPEIKSLVSKTNELLFELCQRSIPLDMNALLRELERLKFNIDHLTKEEIFNWIDNLIDFYSAKE
jgi:hypothetical protein